MQLATENHTSLLHQCQQGDRRAQHELYTSYASAMLNVSHRILQNKEEAEDVLQESFVKAFKNLESFRGDATFGSWLKRIVVNASLNQLKKRKFVTESIEEDLPLMEEEQEATEPVYTVNDINRAVASLSDGYRAVFTLYMFEDYSHREIADMLGVSESTSKSQLNRARFRVKEWLINKDNYGKG